jgi:hypothetical protein
LSNLSVYLAAVGRIQEAVPPAQEAVAIYRQLAKTNTAYQGDLTRSAANHADLQISLENAPAAVPSYREAMASETQFLQLAAPFLPRQ